MKTIKGRKAIFILSLILVFVTVSGCITGNVPADTSCKQYACRLTTSAARFESKVKDDSGGGVLDRSAEVWVKNIENQATLTQVTANCRTLKKEGSYSSESYWMQPGEEHAYTINMGEGIGEDWKCDNFVIHSGQITGCEVYPVS